MKKNVLHLLLFVLVGYLGLSGCSSQKKGALARFVPLALLGNGKSSLPPVSKTYPTDEIIILSIGQQLTLSPAEHVQGSTYSVSPELPSGLSLDPKTGIISGTASVSFPTTVFTITQTKPDGTKVSWKITIGVNGESSNVSETGTPSFSISSGHYSESKYITITTSLSGGIVRCTFDGTEPTSASEEYSGPIHIWSIAGNSVRCRTFKNGAASGEIVSRIFSYSPLNSGQTSVSSQGDDASQNQGIIKSYLDNNDNTVTDKNTGLIWQKCSKGQNSDSSCTGTASPASNWEDAKTYCSSLTLAGKTWRLPTIIELETLADAGQSSSASISGSAFPNTPLQPYWSSTLVSVSSAGPLGFYFRDPRILFTQNQYASNLYVRCIASAKAFVGIHNYSDNQNGTVYDKRTGLYWQKCLSGQNQDTGCSGTADQKSWIDAVSYCNSLELAGRNWRVPNINEFFSIIDFSVTSPPFLSSSIFPNTPSSDSVYTWSSTSDPRSASNAFAFIFHITNSNPGSNPMSKSGLYNNRCVSGP